MQIDWASFVFSPTLPGRNDPKAQSKRWILAALAGLRVREAQEDPERAAPLVMTSGPW